MNRRDSLLIAIHVLNAAWIARMAWLYFHHTGSISYLADLPFVALVVAVVVAHIIRWWRYAAQPWPVAYTSSIELRKDVECVARTMFAAVKYVIRPVPSHKLLQDHAQRTMDENGTIQSATQGDIVRLLLDTPLLLPVHAFCVLLFGFSLAVNVFGNSRRLLGIPYADLVVSYLCTGLFIYSLATVCYIVIQPRPRQA